jgi:hypothetical protein
MGWGYETRVAVVVLCVRPLVSPERRRRRRRNCGTCRRPSLPPRTERSSICSLRSFAFRSNAAAAQLMAAPSTSRSCESGGRESRARRPPTSFSPLDRVIQASMRQHARQKLRFSAGFVCSASAAIHLFTAPPACEHLGYSMPAVRSTSLLVLYGVAFVASRLEHSDVSSPEGLRPEARAHQSVRFQSVKLSAWTGLDSRRLFIARRCRSKEAR